MILLLGGKMKKHSFITYSIAFLIGTCFLFLFSINTTFASSNQKATPTATCSCGCLYYLQKLKGLPMTNGAASAYNYAEWLKDQGKYTVKIITPNKDKPSTLVGTYMVWTNGKLGASKGASSTYGHIAIVKTSSYDKSTKKWTFTFQNACWFGTTVKKIDDSTKCNYVTISKKIFSDLKGITFYTFKKK
jgi:hypothetical protein